MSSISDDIRSALERPDGISEEVMTPLAARFDEAVAVVNQRLDEAVSLLRKNLRSEAIQSANRRPNLLDLAASLDFPELDEWMEILQFLGCRVPRKIDFGKVQQINEAFVEGQPLDQLLKKHRMLAIARAPLNWRLVVLRQIATLDPMNPVWLEDIEAYEAERLKTLKGDVRAALDSADISKVYHLYDELTKQTWSHPVPEGLVPSLKSAIKANVYEQKITQLRDLSKKLHAALSEFNDTSARTLLGEWDELTSKLEGGVPPDLKEEVSPVVDWIAEIEAGEEESRRRSAAIQRWESTLDNSRDLAVLQKSYSIVQQFSEPPPPELVQRHNNLVRQIELSATRKTQFRIVAVIAATVFVAVGVGVWQLGEMKSRRLQQTIDSFAKLVNEQRTDEAAQFWERTKTQYPEMVEAPQLVSLKGELDTLISKEADRVREFESYLSKALDIDSGEVDRKALEEAEKLAVSEPEKSKVFELRRQYDDFMRKKAALDTKNASGELSGLRERLAEIESMEEADIDLGDVNALIVDLENIRKFYPLRDSTIDAQVNVVVAKATQLEKDIGEHQRAAAMQAQARKPVLDAKTLVELQGALQRYARVITSEYLAQEISRSAGEKALWDKVMGVNALSDELRKKIAGGLTVDELSELKSLASKISANVKANPLLELYDAKLSSTYIGLDGREDVFEKFGEEIDDLPFSDLITIQGRKPSDEASDVFSYLMYLNDYLRAKEKLESEGTVGGIELIISDSKSIEQSTLVGPIKRAHVEPNATIEWLTEEYRTRRKDFEENWDLTFIDLALDVAKRVDLQWEIKEEILQTVLLHGIKGSVFLEGKGTNSLDFLQSRSEIRSKWFKPVTPSNVLDTNVQEKVLRVLRDIRNEIPDALEGLRSLMFLRYDFVGVVDRTADGEPLVIFKSQPEESCPLYVVRSAPSDPAAAEMVAIGNWDQDQVVLEKESKELVAGRPVFIMLGNEP